MGDVYLGAPLRHPVDPRHRMVTTKYNPARPWTPENAVGIGGAYLCVYGMEGPGGYQFVGRTIQMWNPLRETEYFKKGKPWLLNFFDRLKFYPCSADEILQYRDDFLRGKSTLILRKLHLIWVSTRNILKVSKSPLQKSRHIKEASFQAERQRWIENGLDHFESDTETEDTHADDVLPDGCEAINATIPGSVWKCLD